MFCNNNNWSKRSIGYNEIGNKFSFAGWTVGWSCVKSRVRSLGTIGSPYSKGAMLTCRCSLWLASCIRRRPWSVGNANYFLKKPIFFDLLLVLECRLLSDHSRRTLQLIRSAWPKNSHRKLERLVQWWGKKLQVIFLRFWLNQGADRFSKDEVFVN